MKPSEIELHAYYTNDQGGVRRVDSFGRRRLDLEYTVISGRGGYGAVAAGRFECLTSTFARWAARRLTGEEIEELNR